MKTLENVEAWLLNVPSAKKTAICVVIVSLLISTTMAVSAFFLSGYFVFENYAGIQHYLQIVEVARLGFGEEALFRLLPMVALFTFSRNLALTFLVCCLVTYVFTMHHPPIGLGAQLFVVVLPSTAMFVMYLKFGGYAKKTGRAFIVVGLVHTFSNLAFPYLGRWLATL